LQSYLDVVGCIDVKDISTNTPRIDSDENITKHRNENIAKDIDRNLDENITEDINTAKRSNENITSNTAETFNESIAEEIRNNDPNEHISGRRNENIIWGSESISTSGSKSGEDGQLEGLPLENSPLTENETEKDEVKGNHQQLHPNIFLYECLTNKRVTPANHLQDIRHIFLRPCFQI
jgi:hypothetical protein